MAMATTTTKPRVSKIVGIQFSILSPEEIKKNAVTEITSRDTYIGNKPVLGGLFCPYMGVSEPGMLCPTDGLDYMQTPGYFGYIQLAMPVFYYQHLNTIHKILRCVCLKCSRLLINKEQHKQALKMSPDERWSYVFGVASKVKRCGDDNEEGCGCLMPKKIKKENLATLIAEWDSDGVKGMSEEDAKKMNMQLTPDIVLKIFRRISDDDVSFMGFSPTFSRPDWMICQVLAVPPPAVRPSIKMDGQQRSEDDLTHIIVNIVKANKTLQEKIRDGAQASVWHMVLQYYCATLVDNNIPGAAPVAQRSGRKLKSIKERLNGKGGRVRGNLMGKRVDFSARSVITPDPNLSIRELGVPLKIAKNITKPVVVNDMNRRFLMRLVRNGPEEYPGAKILERKGGESISLRYADRENIVLYNGDIVHRHMMDGDGVLFNRQPTLHRMSMMCHIARIMRQGDTFRMNVGDTKPYNADFDGDEMNMHMPQDEEAEAELKNLAAVPYQIISPAKNQSIIGIFQDSLVGSYRLTRPNVSFTPREAMNLLMAYNGINEGLFATQAERITSFQILSQIMPAFTMKYKTKGFGENDDFATSPGVLEIVDGKYLRGQLDKDVLGGGSNGLITRTCNDFGNMAAAAFIDDLQNIVTEYMKSSAYSVGISDLIADRATNEQITQSITAKKKEVKNLIDQTYLGFFENATGNTNEDEFEFQVTNILNKATNDSGKIGLKSLSKDNRFVTMVKSGSKGSDLNISQMIACLGQQLIDGKRIPYGFENRTLPHFTKYDDSPGARGFVENSFISGLTPEELFFHAMGGRVGLIDTAVKSVTWETPVVVVENDEPKYVKIGEWIDAHISSSSSVQRMTEQNMEYLELDHPVKIVTMDYDGHVSWETVSAVTRHDPGEKLYKITTHAGRYVTVTANKSLLVWNAELGEFREKYTDEIKVGDFVPVAKHVRDLRSGVGIDEIQMTKYFPKSEFIYGSEVKTAIEMMNESMQDRKKIPSNWWDENNNTAFTLPFDSKAKLQRAIVRSKIDELSANGVYPPSGSRQWGIVPETFELNYENGTFIGLFIAEGNINGANIYITNNDSKIREFVKTWFAKYSIKCKEDIRKNAANGTTSTVVGTSCILAKFITQLVGHGADSKHVPNEAYISNMEFVKGIISGYISGDGHVSRNSIESSSCSQRLTEDIAFLCSRIGVHARVFKSQLKRNNFGTKNIKPSYRLSIRSTNGQLFAEQIDLLHDQKNDRLKSITWTSALNKVQQHNDVVLDAIVSIEYVDPALHPKMYDLTIPTTLNFGLANGLQVRDTSSTGYIQRRLIKGMEDLKIEYDMTVRNNKGRVVQFSYGEDGIDPVKVESQIIPLVNLGLDEIYAHYHMPSSDPKDVVFTAAFTKGVISRMKKQKAENDAKCKHWIDFMIEQRENIIKCVFRNKNTDRVFLPVAFAHTINNVKGLQQINNNSIVDITPLEAFAMIEAAYKRLETMHYCAPTQLFKVMFFYYLSPKDLLMVKRFNQKALTVLLEMIVLKYKNSLIAPGEMVGMISAQSIGEPTTQLTLNSVSYDTRVMLRIDGQIKVFQIGEYIDQYIEKAERMENHPNDTKLGYINADEDVFIPSVDALGITSWKRVEAVTRHPVVNVDGTNTVLRVTTEDGRQVIATKAKSFLSIDANNQLAATNGSDLKVGDYIPINQRAFEMPENDSFDVSIILKKSEYSFGSEIMKALSYCHERNWWANHANIDFVVPYARSDSLLEATNGKCRQGANTKQSFETGIVYLKHKGKQSRIPEKIPYDFEFGYLIGAYCAEGCITKTQISISNNDVKFFEPINALMLRWGITTKYYVVSNKNGQEGWTSSDLRIYSKLLTEILNALCGKGSDNKFIHSELLNGNKEFMRGVLSGYFGGDGAIDKKTKYISAYSVSRKLLENLQIMLGFGFGIYSKITKPTKCETNNRGSKNILQGYTICIKSDGAVKFANEMRLFIDYKQARLDEMAKASTKSSEVNDVIPTFVHNGKVQTNMNRKKLAAIIGTNPFPDVRFDKIVSIEEIPNPTEWMYDFTVEETRTFIVENGMGCYDTFHTAGSGVAMKANVTRGVPRIEELLSITENPKNSSLTICLKKDEETDCERAKELIAQIELTQLSELVESVSICFDPDDLNTLIQEDRSTMLQYYEYQRLLQECAGIDAPEAEDDLAARSKWIIRMVMSREAMLDKRITMDDVHFAIKNSHGDDVSCIYADYNADKLVFRLRMNNINGKKPLKPKENPLDQSDKIYLLKAFQDQLLNNIVLRGLKNISKVTLRKLMDTLHKEDGAYVKKETWVLDTKGTNLMDVLALDYIDVGRTISDDIQEIRSVLGIEAAREALLTEMTGVFENDGTYINYHHLSLLCDRMTASAGMVSIFRHGINNDNIGPIAKASFEETPEMFLKAARHAELDQMRGISANVMCGQEGYYGTSSFQVMLDLPHMIAKMEDVAFQAQNDQAEIAEAMGAAAMDTSACAFENLTIESNVGSIQKVDLGQGADNYNVGF
jgi:DNA-directed RNA polymerase beta' subunit